MKEVIPYIFAGDTKPFTVHLFHDDQVSFGIANGSTVKAYLRREELVVDPETEVASIAQVANGPLLTLNSSTAGANWATGVVSIAYPSDAELKPGMFDVVVIVEQGGTIDTFIGHNRIRVYEKVDFA